MNASDKHLNTECVENLYWKKAPAGHYKIWIENNQKRTGVGESTPFTVRLTKQGEVIEKTFDDLEEYEEQPCFEFDLEEQAEVEAEVEKAAVLVAQLEGDAADMRAGHLSLWLAQPIIESAAEIYARTKAIRVFGSQVAALRQQAESEMARGKHDAALADLQKAIALATEHGIDTAKLELLLERARVGSAERSDVAVEAIGEDVDHSAVEAAGKAAAAKVFTELDLSEAGTLNYRRFIAWWQKASKAKHSAKRITDEELQQTMEIWHDFDEDGRGVTASGLGGVMTGMMRAGVIRISSTGHIVHRHNESHRKRGTTGMGGMEGHVTHTAVHVTMETRTHSGSIIVEDQEQEWNEDKS
eukprot:COSAG02_NODE_13217_length_1425_cov_0.748869_1_plen_357_part_00